MTIRPLRDNVLIEKIIPKNTTKSGIYLPESRANGIYAWGVVIAIGCKVRHLKVGDRCRYTKLLAWQWDKTQALLKEDICDCIDTEGREDGSRNVVS